MRLLAVWKLLAIVLGFVSSAAGTNTTQNYFEIAERLGVNIHGLPSRTVSKTIVPIIMARAGYAYDMDTVYRLMKSMGFPTTHRESVHVITSMLPMHIRPLVKAACRRSSGVCVLVHVLLQLQVEGHRNYLVVQSAHGGLPSSRRRKGNDSTHDSSGDRSCGAEGHRATKLQAASCGVRQRGSGHAESMDASSEDFLDASALSMDGLSLSEHNASADSAACGGSGGVNSPRSPLNGSIVNGGDETPVFQSPGGNEFGFSPASGIVFSPAVFDPAESGDVGRSTRRSSPESSCRRGMNFSENQEMSQNATQIMPGATAHCTGAGDGVYKTGDWVNYAGRDGTTQIVQIVSVDNREVPPSYGIQFSSGAYRETEAGRILGAAAGHCGAEAQMEDGRGIAGQSGQRAEASSGRKKESAWVEEARQLNYILPKGSTMEDVASVMNVRWDPYPSDMPADCQKAKKIRDSVWHRNSRRVVNQIKSEQVDRREDLNVGQCIRAALEQQALARGFPQDAVTQYSLLQLQQVLKATHGAPVPGMPEPTQPTPADVHWLGQQPLGAPYDVSGKHSISQQQKTEVDRLRTEHREQCFGKFLQYQDGIQWALCANCMERKLAAAPYKKLKNTDLLWCPRCLRGANSKNQDQVFEHQYWNNEPGQRAHFSPVPKVLGDLREVEAMLIARISPVFKVQVLKGGVTQSVGNTIAFCNDQSALVSVLPRLPAELEYLFVRRQSMKQSTNQKIFKVRRSSCCFYCFRNTMGGA